MLGVDDEPYTSFEHLIGTLAALQVHSFVDIYVAQDERNSSQYILQVNMKSACQVVESKVWKNEQPIPRTLLLARGIFVIPAALSGEFTTATDPETVELEEFKLQDAR